MKQTGYIRHKLMSLGTLTVLAVMSAPSLNAEVKQLSVEDYTKLENEDDLVKEALVKGDLLKISFETSYGDKPVYRAFPEYYKRFTYTWKDSQGVQHVSNLTDRATDPNQIVELLKTIYTDPRIPGYIEDISYNNETEQEYDWYTNQIDRTKKDNSTLENGTFMAHTRAASGIFSNNEVPMTRNGYNIIDYPAQDFYPFNITKAPERPLNGATALLVEMKANYYGKNSNNTYKNLCEGIAKNPDNTYRIDDPVMKSLEYIDAVTLIANERYVDQGEKGFLFNIEGYYSKYFIVTKGSPRPDKWTPHKITDNDGNVITENYHAGYPFYGMFEEFSPANDGPMCNAFIEMDNGRAFVVDHNCSSVIMQQHDVMMGAETSYETRNQKFHVNLMFFLPDMRYAGDTAYKSGNYVDFEKAFPDFRNGDLGGDAEKGNPVAPDPSRPDLKTPSLYAPYTFYAADHQPYFFFNKIKAEIDDAVIVNHPDYPGKALIPIKWKSNYKDIVNQEYVPESFWIRRVYNGTVDPQNIPLDQIVIRPAQDPGETPFPKTKEEIGDYTWKYPGYGNSLLRSQKDPVLVYVIEDFDPKVNGGQSYSYVIKGNRTESNFTLIESNVVTAVLPFSADGSWMTIELNRAKSDYDMERQVNVYANTIDYIQVQDASGNPTKAGNLMVNELVEIVPEFTDANNYKRSFKIKEGNIYIYRRWTDDDGNEQNKVIYTLPVSEESMTIIYDQAVLRLVEQKVVDLEDQAIMGDGLQPYRNLLNLRENGLIKKGTEDDKLTDVKVAIVFKFDARQDITDKDNLVPWTSIGTNGKLLGYFIDDHEDDDESSEFSVSTAENHFPTKYTYNIAFRELSESGGEVNAPLVSNSVDVLVANRLVYAGYIPYTENEVKEEMWHTYTKEEDIYADGNLLAPNVQGIAVRVSNSALVKNYDVYRLPNLKTRSANIGSDKKLVARLWRNSDGSFQPRVFDGSIIVEDEHEYEDASAIDRPASGAGYIGKIPVELAVEVEPYDQFALIINSTDQPESPYRNNTYGSKIVHMPEPPTVQYTSGIMKWVDNNTYAAEFKAKPVYPEIPKEFQHGDWYEVAGYGLWTYEHPDYPVWGDMYPENCVMENKWHWLDQNEFGTAELAEGTAEGTMLYTFTHDVGYPSFHKPVVLTATTRMYTRLKPNEDDHCIVFDRMKVEDVVTSPEDADTPEAIDEEVVEVPYYLVSDVTTHIGMFGSTTTGVDDIDVDNIPFRYFNLNGVEVGSEGLTPGIYIRTNGIVTEKVRIK